MPALKKASTAYVDRQKDRRNKKREDEKAAKEKVREMEEDRQKQKRAQEAGKEGPFRAYVSCLLKILSWTCQERAQVHNQQDRGGAVLFQRSCLQPAQLAAHRKKPKSTTRRTGVCLSFSERLCTCDFGVDRDQDQNQVMTMMTGRKPRR